MSKFGNGKMIDLKLAVATATALARKSFPQRWIQFIITLSRADLAQIDGVASDRISQMFLAKNGGAIDNHSLDEEKMAKFLSLRAAYIFESLQATCCGPDRRTTTDMSGAFGLITQDM